jgi:hypothetical protein
MGCGVGAFGVSSSAASLDALVLRQVRTLTNGEVGPDRGADDVSEMLGLRTVCAAQYVEEQKRRGRISQVYHRRDSLRMISAKVVARVSI